MQEISTTAFDHVDETAEPERLIGYLDSVGSAISAYKQQMIGLQGARERDVLLDLGCGAGDDARTLARLVGPEGRVVGVDNSEAMVAEARRRQDGSELPVEFLLGEAHGLDLPDELFDGCRAERVFQHLADPRAALAELARVSRPGAAIVIGDPDWETLVIDSSDPPLTRRIKCHLVECVAGGGIAHEVRGLMRELGLQELSVTPMTIVLTEFGTAEMAVQVGAAARRACDADVITPAEHDAWIADLRARDTADRFLLAFTSYVTRGHRPR
jgi:ubiquinone/menaquinone biosynthesis C-methylase UbiE